MAATPYENHDVHRARRQRARLPAPQGRAQSLCHPHADRARDRGQAQRSRFAHAGLAHGERVVFADSLPSSIQGARPPKRLQRWRPKLQRSRHDARGLPRRAPLSREGHADAEARPGALRTDRLPHKPHHHGRRHSLGEALDRDSRGRALHTWNGCRVLAAGEVFLMDWPSEDSFDGRYFGPLPASTIVARADPLWTSEED
jgi:Signal peptidase, peptidase S26